MSYGIIVDGSGNGFLSFYTNLPVSNPQLGSVTTLESFGSGQTTDDILFMAADKTSDTTQGGLALEGDFTTPGGHGGVTGIALAFTGSVNAGDRYELVWFDGQGGVGFMTDPSFVIPSDGSVVNQDSAFTGIDPVRSASSIPEASGALLGLIGAAALLRRRRR